MLTLPLRRAAQRGITLIELMVTVALAVLLLGLAAPSFAEWIQNSRVRTVSDALQNGLRLAQAEAVRLNRQVVFFVTTSSTCTTSATAATSGAFWAIRTVPLLAGESARMVQCGNLSDLAQGVTITAPSGNAMRPVCFNSMGRQVASSATVNGVGTACTVTNAAGNVFVVSSPNATRTLNVLVTLGGQVRMCDPTRTLSDTNPDGCPA